MYGRPQLRLGPLRELVGQRLRYKGRVYEVIDLLEEDVELVLESVDSVAIQADQFGEAHRQVPETVTVPVWDPIRGTLHEEFTRLRHALKAARTRAKSSAVSTP
jgi:hypothetical protein